MTRLVARRDTARRMVTGPVPVPRGDAGPAWVHVTPSGSRWARVDGAWCAWSGVLGQWLPLPFTSSASAATVERHMLTRGNPFKGEQ